MAKPVEFPQQNVVFGKNQPEYLPLPAFLAKSKVGEAVTCWQFSEEELKEVIRTGRVYLTQLTFNQPMQPLNV